jgi:serine phosphatase RsbU (regulator of sigma subunit)/CHASE3 domain sensor protein
VTLRQRILALLGLFVVLIVGNAILAGASIVARDGAIAQLQERYEPARELVNELLARAVDQQTGVRGYVITGDERFLEPYQIGRARSQEILRDLHGLLGDELVYVAGLEAIEDALAEWQAGAAEPEIAAVRAGDDARAMQLVASAVGRERFDALRGRIQDLRRSLKEMEVEAVAQAARGRRDVNRLVAATLLLAAGLALLTALLLRRWITVPLRRLSTSVRLVAAGALHDPIGLDGPPELAALADDTDTMRQRIVAELEATVRANEALAHQAPAVAMLRDELAATHDALPPTLAFAAELQPAVGVLAGDWYDVVVTPDGLVRLAVVDVAGHGPASGMLALRIKHLLLAALADGQEPGAALAWTAQRLGDTGEAFATVFVAAVDPAGVDSRYASAGHPPAFVATASGEPWQLVPTGPLLGPLPGRWETRPFRLGPDDLLFAYTDGLLEARDAGGAQFGAGRVLALLDEHDEPVELVRAALAAVRDFAEGRLEDDVTVLAVRRAAVLDIDEAAADDDGPAVVTTP